MKSCSFLRLQKMIGFLYPIYPIFTWYLAASTHLQLVLYYSRPLDLGRAFRQHFSRNACANAARFASLVCLLTFSSSPCPPQHLHPRHLVLELDALGAEIDRTAAVGACTEKICQ